MTLRINIAREFSPVPIARYKEGDATDDKSGETFRDNCLYPKIRQAIDSGDVLEVDFAGIRSVSASFLEESFGGLVRKYHISAVKILDTVKFLPEKSYFDPYIRITKKYINEARADDA